MAQANKYTKLRRSDIRRDGRLDFRVYGVSVGVTAEKIWHLVEVYKRLQKTFPNNLEKCEGQNVEYRFDIGWTRGGGYELRRNHERIVAPTNKEGFFDAVESQIRITVAEFASEKVFLHAGVVGWKDHAILLPAISFSGKTTLVAELVKRGAFYYSDEYAVLDREGNVEPFPKWLSMRSDEKPFKQIETPVERFGVAGTRAIPVGLVLLAKFDRRKKNGARFGRGAQIGGGQALMEILPHSLSIRRDPQFVLEVLNKLVARAIIVKTVRGEAAEFAETLLQYFEKCIDEKFSER